MRQKKIQEIPRFKKGLISGYNLRSKKRKELYKREAKIKMGKKQSPWFKDDDEDSGMVEYINDKLKKGLLREYDLRSGKKIYGILAKRLKHGKFDEEKAKTKRKQNLGSEDEEGESSVPGTTEADLQRNILQWLMKKYEKLKIVRLYIGEQIVKDKKSEQRGMSIVLVIDRLQVIKDKFYTLNGKTYSIKCKLWRTPSVEGVKVSSFETNNTVDNKIRSTIEGIMETKTDSLFNQHSNLEFISMSAYRSKDNGNVIIKEPCIALYCSCKGVVPLKEEGFPKQLGNIKTDVREGFFYQFPGFVRGSTEVLDPLKMGADIGKADKSSNGTLGGFVTIGSGDIGFITAAHVFKNVPEYFTSKNKFNVLQPSRGFRGGDVCGVCEKSFYTAGLFEGHTIDAALVRITRRKPTRGLFAGMTEQQLEESGYSLQMLPEYSDGAIRDFGTEQTCRTNPCVKFGASSGLTRGMLWTKGMSVRWIDDVITLGNIHSRYDVKYFKQLQVIGLHNLSFAQHGDSGALVFQIDSDKTEKENDQHLVCIGMVVGGTSDNKTVLTPIVPILDALKVKMHHFIPSNMDEF